MHICRSGNGGEFPGWRIGVNLRRFGQVLIGLLLILGMFQFSGCTSRSIYQDDLYNPPVYWGEHVVEPGETLYSIAWRYGRNYKELAAANDIPPPYDIKPGEVIYLNRHAHVTRSHPAPAPEKSHARHSHHQVVQRSKTSDKNNSLQTPSRPDADIHWHWPHVGPIIAKFSLSGKVNKGIDIAGRLGEPVKAAAAGQVVYAGNGLRGYGELIIINHNEHFLSAYAHNSRILVKEGEDVRAGQEIAKMGATGSNRVELHFEIRKNGHPVNPLSFLPKR